MPNTINAPLIVAITSSALFDLRESHRVFEEEGTTAYGKYQREHENEPLTPGSAFYFAKKLLSIQPEQPIAEVILLSRNSSDTGLRVFNSIDHYKLPISRAAFTSGENPYRYAQAFGAHLFLSTNPDDVRMALSSNCAAATILPGNADSAKTDSHSQLRIAFDGDAVLFDDSSEKIYQSGGLDAFNDNEKKSAHSPMGGGPFKGFLAALHELQQRYPADACPFRTALVTARQAPAHERVIRTLREWNIRIDESLFLGGLSKTEFLEAFQADIFFDDQMVHCEPASKTIPTGHVPPPTCA